MLNIQRFSNGKIVFSLSGRLEFEDVSELQRLIGLEAADAVIAMDIRELTLIDREAVAFLARCERGGIELENCPQYIRESIDAGKGRNKPTD